MAIEVICPVCNKVARGRFCEYCGYELHYLPASVGQNIIEYETERAEHYRALLDKYDEGLRNGEQFSEQLAVKDKEVADLTIRNEELNASLQEALKQQKEMSSIVARRIPLAFLVMMQFDKLTSIFGIYEGDNIFGSQVFCSAHVVDRHFSVRTQSYRDSKGRVRIKFFVSPVDGHIYRSAQSSNEISSEVEMEMMDSIYIENVRFTLLANLVTE